MRISDWSSDVCSSDLDRLIISAIEHPSVAAAAQALMPHGVDVTTVGVDADGLLDLEALETALGDGASLVSVMQVNNEIGTIQPISDIAAMCTMLDTPRSEEHTSELQSLMRISYAVFCLKKTKNAHQKE